MNNIFRIVTPETSGLFSIYSACSWWEVTKKHNIKKQIYAIELPLIRKKLNEIEDFDTLMAEKNPSRIYIANVTALMNGKGKLKNPNNFKKHKLFHLYKQLKKENAPYIFTEMVVRRINWRERAYFEKITDVSLDVFELFKV